MSGRGNSENIEAKYSDEAKTYYKKWIWSYVSVLGLKAANRADEQELGSFVNERHSDSQGFSQAHQALSLLVVQLDANQLRIERAGMLIFLPDHREVSLGLKLQFMNTSN